MLEINNRKICEYCFTDSPQIGSVCPRCGGADHVKKYHGTLARGSILAGKYIIGRVLGKGGFGITYQCYDLINNRIVAIKEYMPDTLAYRANDTGRVISYEGERGAYYQAGAKKFLDEAKLVAKFNGNPHITTVYEFFYENNTSYYAMEYLDGCDLKSYVESKGGTINEAAALKVVASVSKALADIHSVKVLHRDISPDNIYVCRNGNIKLIDFGAARQLVSEASNSLSVILKQGFAPFEQYQKKGNQGPWTDIYALGATAYYIITGKMIPEAVKRIENKSVDMSGISPAFAAMLSKMIAFDIKDRYANAKHLQKAINDLVKAEGNAKAPGANSSYAQQGTASNQSGGNGVNNSQSNAAQSPKPSVNYGAGGFSESNEVSSRGGGKRTVCKCVKCGKIIPSGASLCSACGKKSSQNPDYPVSGNSTSGKKAVVIAAVAGGLVLLLLIASIYFGFFYEENYRRINIYELNNTTTYFSNIL